MTQGDKLYINVGSLGCPGVDKNITRAGIVNIDNSNIDVEIIDVKYHADEVIRAIDEINYPDAENIKRFFYGI